MKKIIFTVTNDLSYDQRMIKICSSLANAGYDVLLVGRKLKTSLPLTEQPFKQKRLKCFFRRSVLFYAEYNIRLCAYLLLNRADCICAIDLDTILPAYFISIIKGWKRVYDAHEYFSQQKEIVQRPGIYKIWHWIEKFAVPKFKNGYTVSPMIMRDFSNLYGVKYELVRNAPLYANQEMRPREHFVLMQGAVNEGRSLETLIPAMKEIDMPLIIVGDGNFMNQTRQLITENGLKDKVILKGMRPPSELYNFTSTARIGVSLQDGTGLNNIYSLPNKMFDYMHAGTPQVCTSSEAIHLLNKQYEFCLEIPDNSIENLQFAIYKLAKDNRLWEKLSHNSLLAARELNWQNEEKTLIYFYKKLFA